MSELHLRPLAVPYYYEDEYDEDLEGEDWPETKKSSAFDSQVGGSHYRDMAVQPLEYIVKNGIPFLEGNVIKYVTRWTRKNGIEDLKKARHYLDMLIEMEEQKNNET